MLESRLLRNVSSSTGTPLGLTCSGADAWWTGAVCGPSWMSTYFSPSSERGRIPAVTPWWRGQAASSISTTMRAWPSAVGSMLVTLPTFAPASRTSLAGTRPEADSGRTMATL